MGLMDWIKGQTFLEVIEWIDDSRDTMVYRFPTYDKMIKFGAQLTVRESQVAIFVKEGKIADIFQPGRYTLTTKNLPILVGIMGIPWGGETPFKSDVYYVNMREFTNLGWGTPNPVLMNSVDFGPVRIRAFGKYTIRVADPAKLLRNIVGTDSRFTVDEILEQLRSEIVQKFADLLAEQKLPVMEMSTRYNEISGQATEAIREGFLNYGLHLGKLVIENITLPEEVEKAVDQRGKMAAIGDLDRFTKLKAAEAIGDAAKTPGGAGGMEIGAGFVMAQQMARALHQPAAPPSAPAAAPTVLCPSCSHPSAPGNFCVNCGKPLKVSSSCRACNREVPPGSRFCSECGAKIL